MKGLFSPPFPVPIGRFHHPEVLRLVQSLNAERARDMGKAGAEQPLDTQKKTDTPANPPSNSKSHD